MPQKYKVLLFVLILIAIVVWIAIITFPSDRLKIVTCDVGQGDAIILIHKSLQVLVDGGPSNQVIDCLERYVPFWDRNIEMVILTHPDLDHYGGLEEVFSQYQVNMFVTNENDPSTQGFQALKSQVGGLRLNTVNPSESTVLKVGEMEMDVVSANDLVSDSNDSSIVFNLRFGEFDALFTGDIGPEITDLGTITGEIRDIEFLKVPHHGSKNGLTQELLNLAKPEIAVISVGKKNRYGHPSPEILEMLQGIKTLRTDQIGDVIVETDGKSWWIVQ